MPTAFALVVVLFLVGAEQRRRAARRSADFARTGHATIPVFLRHAHDGARWMYGAVELHGDSPPRWAANRDIAQSSAVLEPSRYCIEEVSHGFGVSLKTKPGWVIMRLNSDLGPIELSMTPQDAKTLEGFFAPCSRA